MKKIVLEFETDDLFNDFIGWYCDGGGEDEFYNSQTDCDRPKFFTKINFKNIKGETITFKELKDD